MTPEIFTELENFIQKVEAYGGPKNAASIGLQAYLDQTNTLIKLHNTIFNTKEVKICCKSKYDAMYKSLRNTYYSINKDKKNA